MKIIILGPPGSGKGTQSNLIMRKYNISKISTGDILRNLILKKDPLSLLIKKNIQKGKLIDDNIIINLTIKKIKKKNNNNFILDGFPRTIQQAKKLEEENIFINYIIELVLKEKIIYERILGRRIHINSGRIYHTKYHPPKIPELDDITHEKLITRPDDNITTIKQRLNEYHNMRNIILNFYKKNINNKIINYIKINSEKKKEEVFFKIKKLIKYSS